MDDAEQLEGARQTLGEWNGTQHDEAHLGINPLAGRSDPTQMHGAALRVLASALRV